MLPMFLLPSGPVARGVSKRVGRESHECLVVYRRAVLLWGPRPVCLPVSVSGAVAVYIHSFIHVMY